MSKPVERPLDQHLENLFAKVRNDALAADLHAAYSLVPAGRCFHRPCLVNPDRGSEMLSSSTTTAEERRYYDVHVFCCTNARPKSHPRGSCARSNSVQLRDYFKQKVRGLGLSNIRINAAGCLDRCELGPVIVIYPAGVWYRYESEADVDEIIRSHIQGGHIVERLQLGNTDN